MVNLKVVLKTKPWGMQQTLERNCSTVEEAEEYLVYCAEYEEVVSAEINGNKVD